MGKNSEGKKSERIRRPPARTGELIDSGAPEPAPPMSNKRYRRELAHLQAELVAMQEWVRSSGSKIGIVFEGRDTAGKGGVIKAITERVSLRVFGERCSRCTGLSPRSDAPDRRKGVAAVPTGESAPDRTGETSPANCRTRWHVQSSDEVMSALMSDSRSGLSSADVTVRQDRYGVNEIAAEPAPSAWALAKMQTPQTRVICDGSLTQLPATELVPG